MTDEVDLERLRRDANTELGIPIKVTGYCYVKPYLRLVHHATYVVEREEAQELLKEQFGQVLLATQAARAEGGAVVLPIITSVCLN